MMMKLEVGTLLQSSASKVTSELSREPLGVEIYLFIAHSKLPKGTQENFQVYD